LGHFSAVEWKPPVEEPDADFPYVLTTGRVLWHYHSGTLTRRSVGLTAIYPEARVEINPEDADSLGIADGDRVRLISRRGEVEVAALVSPMTKPGLVFMPFHFVEASANKLTIAALDPIAKIPEYKVCAIRLERVNGGGQ
jgi:anaerobic selenocysteine-containing dehydrogenase